MVCFKYFKILRNESEKDELNRSGCNDQQISPLLILPKSKFKEITAHCGINTYILQSKVRPKMRMGYKSPLYINPEQRHAFFDY